MRLLGLTIDLLDGWRVNALAVLGAVSLLMSMAVVTPAATAAESERVLTGGQVTRDSCADDDYDCWYQYLKDLMPDPDEDDVRLVAILRTADDSCADDDYDCWYQYFKDLMPDLDEDDVRLVAILRTADDSCADDDYDCWYQYFKDLMPDDDAGDGTDSDADARDASRCVEGLDYAGTGCVEDYTGNGKKSGTEAEDSRQLAPVRTISAR